MIPSVAESDSDAKPQRKKKNKKSTMAGDIDLATSEGRANPRFTATWPARSDIFLVRVEAAAKTSMLPAEPAIHGSRHPWIEAFVYQAYRDGVAIDRDRA